MWGIPAAIFFIAFIHRVVPGIVAKDLMQAFGATGAIVGLLSSMYFYSYAGFMIPGGLVIKPPAVPCFSSGIAADDDTTVILHGFFAKDK